MKFGINNNVLYKRERERQLYKLWDIRKYFNWNQKRTTTIEGIFLDIVSTYVLCIYLSIYMYIGSMFESFFVPCIGECFFFPKHELAAMLKIFPEMIFQIKEHNKYIHIYYIQHFQTTEIVLSFCIFRIKIEIENRIPIELIEESKELFNWAQMS